jgi:hypothetical protein
MNPLFSAAANGLLYPLLLQAFSRLRESWHGEWMGLPRVLKACQDFVASPTEGFASSEAQALLACAMALSQQMELNVDAATEPSYHNRLHTADTMCGMAVLLKALSPIDRVCSAEWTAALLLTATAHDYLHPGGANSAPQELELRTVKALQLFFVKHPVPAIWQERIHHMILQTDPALVDANHDKVAGRAFAMDLNWACALMNEADILASATDVFGPALGEQLAAEWQMKNLPLHAIVGQQQGRLAFLKSLRFSTAGSQSLQFPQHVAVQVARLSTPAA